MRRTPRWFPLRPGRRDGRSALRLPPSHKSPAYFFGFSISSASAGTENDTATVLPVPES